MFLSFLGPRKTPGSFSVLDFGSTSVKSVIFDAKNFDRDGRLSLVGLGSEVYPEGVIDSSVISNLDEFTNTARNSLKKASFDCGFNPADVVVGLSGEFIKSVSVKVKVLRDKPDRIIDSSEWEKLGKKVGRTLWESAAGEMATITGNPEAEVQIVDRKLTGVLLDSRPVLGLVGEKAAELVLDYLVSFAQESTLRLLSSICKKIGKRELFKTARIISVFDLLRKNESPLNVIVIDLGGRVTDVGLILGDSLLGVRSVPLGADHFRRPPTAGEADASSQPSVNDSSIQDWLSAIETALADFEGVRTFPPKIIVCGEGPELLGVEDALVSVPWVRKFPFVTTPVVSDLGGTIDLPLFTDKVGKSTEFLPSVVIGQSFTDYARS